MFRILAAVNQTTSILDENLGIGGLLGLVVKILSYGLGAAAVIGVVVAGIMYLTARDNESQVTVAKQRLLNTVIGLIAWVVMFSVVNWLIPGGVPDPSDPNSNMNVTDRNDENPIQGGGSLGSDDEEESGGGDSNSSEVFRCSEIRKQLLKDGLAGMDLKNKLKEQGCQGL